MAMVRHEAVGVRGESPEAGQVEEASSRPLHDRRHMKNWATSFRADGQEISLQAAVVERVESGRAGGSHGRPEASWRPRWAGFARKNVRCCEAKASRLQIVRKASRLHIIRRTFPPFLSPKQPPGQ